MFIYYNNGALYLFIKKQNGTLEGGAKATRK